MRLYGFVKVRYFDLPQTTKNKSLCDAVTLFIFFEDTKSSVKI